MSSQNACPILAFVFLACVFLAYVFLARVFLARVFLACVFLACVSVPSHVKYFLHIQLPNYQQKKTGKCSKKIYFTFEKINIEICELPSKITGVATCFN